MHVGDLCGMMGIDHTRERTPMNTQDFSVLNLKKAAYSVNETLEILSLGRTSLYRLVKSGDLAPAKFGKKTLFYASDLAEFLFKLRQSSCNSARRTPQR